MPEREHILMNAICGLLALGALGVAVWAVVTGQIGVQGLDGIFLLLVCGLFALVFGIIPMQALRKARSMKGKEAKTPAQASAQKAGDSA